MKLSKNLYVGLSIRGQEKKILDGLTKKTLLSNIYLVVVSDGKDLLEILPAFTIKYPIFKLNVDDLKIVGLAKGKEEAISLVSNMVVDCLKSQENYDIKNYFNF